MSNIFLSLDYELYFGANSGTQKNAILRPTEKLLAVLDKYEVKASFFVDAGYLLRLSELKGKFPVLQKDHEVLTAQLRELVRAGHDIQLHIHPHWEDSTFDGATWKMDTKRYRLHDFTGDEIAGIVYRYKSILADIPKKPVFAFRAGGWRIQPFDKLRHALKENGVWLDSTVFKKLSGKRHQNFGDGAPISGSAWDKLRMLARPSHTVW